MIGLLWRINYWKVSLSHCKANSLIAHYLQVIYHIVESHENVMLYVSEHLRNEQVTKVYLDVSYLSIIASFLSPTLLWIKNNEFTITWFIAMVYSADIYIYILRKQIILQTGITVGFVRNY